MALILHQHSVASVALGEHPGIDRGRLTVNGSALRDYICEQDDRLSDVRVGLAHPGESVRIVCVKDVIQPRVKTIDNGIGEGVVHILDDAAVVTCGPIVGFQEGIIDMSGPGAAHTPFSGRPLIVLEVDTPAALDPHDHEAAVRQVGTTASEYIARSCVDHTPDHTRELKLAPLPSKSGLTRIAYLYMVLSQGLLHDTYVLGKNAMTNLPRTVDPRIGFENGIVSGNCVSACDKNTTYHHQNNPLIARLIEGHGTMWDFAGVVVTNEPTRLADKERSAKEAVDQIRQLGADGVVVSKEGFGNPDADLMMIIRALEQIGVRTVAITDEFAGVDGESQSLADTAPEADAIVSVGNANERIELPAMSKVFGPLPDVSRLAGGYPHSVRSDGTMEVELQAIIGATNQLGFGRLSCRGV